jgi:hypothetical protein
VPEAVGYGPDGAADRFGDGVSDGEGGTDASFPRTWARKAFADPALLFTALQDTASKEWPVLRK